MAMPLVADLDGEQVAENAAVVIEHHRIKSPANDKFAYLAGGSLGNPRVVHFRQIGSVNKLKLILIFGIVTEDTELLINPIAHKPYDRQLR